jgi:glycosyltransferase involved in cell wall biosynthesis
MAGSNSLPFVSIIMPAYNRAFIISESIQSVRNQTYPNWELIIVDDGSDDNTEELVLSVPDSRIRFHKAGRIGLGGKIKNTGIQLAKGPLIAFLDSDDLWAPTKLAQQVAALQQFPEAGFSLTGGYNFREPGKPLDFFYKQTKGWKFGSVFIDLFQSQVAAFIQTLLFRKECLDKTGLFKERKSFSDIDFIAALARHFPAVILFEPLVWRRLHHSNYIHSNWEKSYREGMELLCENKLYLPASVYRNAFFRLWMNFGEKYFGCRRKGKAMHCYFRAWLWKPYSPVPLKKTVKALLKNFS